MSDAGVAAGLRPKSIFGRICDAIKSLFKWLTAKPTNPTIKGDPQYNPIDTDQIKADIELEAQAERLGKAEQPPSDATVHAGLESKIVQIIEKARHDYFNWACERLNIINRSISSADISSMIQNTRGADEGFVDEADAIICRAEPNLKILGESLQSLRGQLNEFRQKNSLRWAANSPSGSLNFLLWTILGLFVVIEGAVNAWFFAQGSDYGLLGGFVNAALFSLINITIAASLGRQGIPYKNHVSPKMRLIGYGSILLSIAAAIFMSFLISHYRDAMTHDVENAAKIAIHNVFNNPLSLQDVHSWLLLVISLLFAGFAVLDGYKIDDPYPGYGKLTRKLDEATIAYNTEMDDVRCQLEAQKDDSIKMIETSLADIERRLDKLSSDIYLKQRTELSLTTSFKDAENCLHELLNTFRDANRMARSTPPPKYFNQWPELKQFDIPPFETEKDFAKHKKQFGAFNQLKREIPAIRSRIISAYNSKHDSLKPLDNHFCSVETEGDDAQAQIA